MAAAWEIYCFLSTSLKTVEKLPFLKANEFFTQAPSWLGESKSCDVCFPGCLSFCSSVLSNLSLGMSLQPKVNDG